MQYRVPAVSCVCSVADRYEDGKRAKRRAKRRERERERERSLADRAVAPFFFFFFLPLSLLSFPFSLNVALRGPLRAVPWCRGLVSVPPPVHSNQATLSLPSLLSAPPSFPCHLLSSPF